MKRGRKTLEAVTKLLTICVMISLSPCSAQAPGDGDERCINDPDAPVYPDNEKTLMDSYHYLQLLPGNGSGTIIPGAVWNDRSLDGNDELNTINPTYWQQGAGGSCRFQVRVCGWRKAGADQNNWLFTQHISKDFDSSSHDYLVEIRVQVIYALQSCRSRLGCDMGFRLLNYKTNTQQLPSTTGSGYMNTTNYEQFGRARSTTPDGARFETHTFTLGPSETGFYVALQDTGTCVGISRLRVYRYNCPPRQVGLAFYPETPAGVSDIQDVNVSCNATNYGSPQVTCHSNGTWGPENPVCKCECGFEEKSSQCSECQVGYYSPGDGIPCQPCPANTVMNQPDYHKCNCSCLPNYFRYKAGVSRPNIPGITWPAFNEGPSVGCTKPPSAPRNLRLTTKTTSITVSWSSPIETGGRSDLYYQIEYFPTNSQENRGVKYMRSTRYTITNLKPFTQYTVKVSAHNGVSDQDPDRSRSRTIEQTNRTLRDACSYGDVRLRNGTTDYEGRVEVCLGGIWGTVCDDDWDSRDATVICRQLGHSDLGAIATRGGYFLPGTGSVLLNEVACTGTETSITQCPLRDHDCSHFEDAGVICEAKGFSCDDGDVRLVGGNNYGGEVEYCRSNSFGRICNNDRQWDAAEAKVVCNQLGFKGDANTINIYNFRRSARPTYVYGVVCTGNETSLLNCTKRETEVGFFCLEVFDVGVLCSPPSPICINGEIRLRGGRISSEGRVELCINNHWGTVCANGWGAEESKVVCRSLGYSENDSIPNSYFGPGTGPILSDMECSGDERTLTDCPHSGIGNNFCIHQQDAGVACKDPEHSCEDGDIRLADGKTKNEGRVEICFEDHWGTVCGHLFTNVDASVVCRQLGFEPQGIVIPLTPFGEGVGRIHLDDIDCIGYENRLEQCGHIGIGSSNCAHGEDVSILCPSNATKRDCENGNVRLTDGSGNYSGRVEVCFNNIWGTVCDDGWGVDEAEVVCKQLGFDPEGAFPLSAAFFGRGTGPSFLSGVNCDPRSHSSITECFVTGEVGQFPCDHRNDASVICSSACDTCNCTNGDIRLVGGPTSREGRVELCLNGMWGTICDSFWNNQDAVVVCRQLGYSQTGAVGFTGAEYGEGEGAIFFDAFFCSGTEESLLDCYHQRVEEGGCSHQQDASVNCSGNVLESMSSDFLVAFGRNDLGGIISNLTLFITSNEPDPVIVKIESLRGFNFTGVVTQNSPLTIHVPEFFQVTSITQRDKGIRISAGKSKLSVYGRNYMRYTSDAFLALPCERIAVENYEYYGVTYSDGSIRPSHVLIVGCEDNTVFQIGSDVIHLSKMETYLWEGTNDITGTKIVSNRPIAVFSGHQCTFIPSSVGACDHLTEQIPPTAIWGRNFLSASLSGRSSGDIYRMISSENSTNVVVNCSTFSQLQTHYLTLAGFWQEFNTSDESFCSISSDKPLLLMQFGLGLGADFITGDPFMMMIAPVEQFSSNYIFNAFPEFSTNYITIYVSPDDYHPESIVVDNTDLQNAVWNTIYCSNATICGYVAYVTLTPGEHQVFHRDVSAHIGVSVYGFSAYNSYGYPGRPIPIQSLDCKVSEVSDVIVDCEGISPQIYARCSFNRGPFHPCTLPIVLNSDVSPPGTHSVRVFTKSSASENVSYIISSTDRPTVSAQVPKLGVYLIKDSPEITNNNVRAEFQITRPVVGVRCFLRSQYYRLWQDCSSGRVSFPILRPGPHVLKIQAYNRKTDVAFVKRGFVVNSDPNFCSLVLVNRGVTISEDGTRAVVQVRLYGPAIYLSCVLDGGFPFICIIPVELSALTRGQHELLISPVGCSGGSKTLSVKFST